MFDFRREGGWSLTQMIGDDGVFREAVEVNTVSDDGEIEATREKLMFDFQTEVGMKDAILKGNESGFRRR
ncbi:hypothetical protein HanRHA438_Chr03g0122071 [Helianthus annuus]|nr:hypothetical protein HanIR_Chr03g0120101 [Helianthus annuus]KAJ0935660.1 hypothetical protein HanRHA438_Chr03g0122071 [Helianthus annuus]KAJ0943568.1 hypothetical protein HanPSC8_Chr03g0106261 [Helianthus annuus]